MRGAKGRELGQDAEEMGRDRKGAKNSRVCHSHLLQYFPLIAQGSASPNLEFTQKKEEPPAAGTPVESKPTSEKKGAQTPPAAKDVEGPEKKGDKPAEQSGDKEYDALAKTEGLGAGSNEKVDAKSKASKKDKEQSAKCPDVFIQSSILTAEVKQLLKDNENGLGDAIRCGDECRASGANCDSEWHGNCCARNQALEMVGTEQTPRFTQGNRMGEPCSVRFECTDACACDPATCCNRIVQKGRKHPLLIFFHPVKGWTIRTLAEMGVWDMIGEYCGVVQTEPSRTAKAKAYDVDLQYPVKRANGSMGNLYVAADAKGNETRFLSHGCDPNARMEPYIIERHGLFANTMVFFPIRSLIRGEEFVFDYMPDLTPEDAECHYKMYFNECGCKSPKCRFTKEKIEAAERALEMEELNEEEDGDGSVARKKTKSSPAVKRRRLLRISDDDDS